MARASATPSLVSKTIESVVNGVSQQPPTIRLPSQAEAQDNMLSSILAGAARRPPTEHVGVLTTDAKPTKGYKTHIRARDTAQQHYVLIEDGVIRVFNLDTGIEAIVTGGTSAYLDIAGDDASQAFAITSVADYSFVVNKEVVVAMTGTISEYPTDDFLIYFFETAAATNSHVWTQTIGTTSRSLAQNIGSPSTTNDFRDAVYETIYQTTHFPNWTFDEGYGWNLIYGNQSGGTLTTATTTGEIVYFPTYQYSDEVYSFIYKSVQNFSDLPSRGVDQFKCKVIGADGNQATDYWVLYDSVVGAWIETVAFGVDNDFNDATLPHTLVQDSVGLGAGGADEFTFGPQEYKQRTKGDALTAPEPSFIGKTISDVFFHKNRLCFLSEEGCVTSEAGDFFDFWPSTVTTIVDSDPIDAASTNNRIALLDHGVPFDKEVYLFSSSGGVQNVLTGGEALTSANAEVVEASAYPVSPLARPKALGKSIYYAVDRGISTAMMEYSVDDTGASAFDVTAHVPTYIGPNVKELSASSKENILTMLSADETDRLFVYTFFEDKGAKVQQSWSRWIFDDDYDILGADWIDEILYLIVQRTDGLHLEKINVTTLTDGALPYRVHLDSQEELLGVYTPNNNLTTWTTESGSDPATYGTYRAVLTGAAHGDALGHKLELDYVATNKLTAVGNHSADVAILGRTYTHTYEFTKPIITVPGDNAGAREAVTQGRLQISKFKFLMRSSGGYTATVQSDEVNSAEVVIAEDPFVYEAPDKILNASTVSPAHPRTVDEFEFPVGMEAKYARITLSGDSHLPCLLVGAEWLGFYFATSARV